MDLTQVGTMPSKKTAFLVLLVLLVIVYLVDAQTEVSVMEDTSEPVGAKRFGRKKTYQEFVGAANMNPNFKIGIAYKQLPDIELPTYLKFKEKYLTPVVNQDQCTSCWAISVCHLIADRIALYTKGAIKRPLSYQELVSCFNNKDDTGCTVGGIPEQAYRHIAENGVGTEEHYPYVQANTTKIAKCDPSKQKGFRTFIQKNSIRSLCIDPDNYKKGSTQWQKTIDQNTKNMRTELFLNGPFCITIMVYSSLYNFDGLSIYDPPVNKLGKFIGGHAALCVGYAEEVDGEEPGFDGNYWVIKNSWSASHPLKSPASKGFLYIRAGKNTIGVESRASSCQVAITAEIQKNMVKSLDESRYISYSQYSNDPNRKLWVQKSTRLRSLLK